MYHPWDWIYDEMLAWKWLCGLLDRSCNPRVSDLDQYLPTRMSCMFHETNWLRYEMLGYLHYSIRFRDQIFRCKVEGDESISLLTFALVFLISKDVTKTCHLSGTSEARYIVEKIVLLKIKNFFQKFDQRRTQIMLQYWGSMFLPPCFSVHVDNLFTTSYPSVDRDWIVEHSTSLPVQLRSFAWRLSRSHAMFCNWCERTRHDWRSPAKVIQQAKWIKTLRLMK